jgi:hypothetical protein
MTHLKGSNQQSALSNQPKKQLRENERFRTVDLSRCPNSQLNFRMPFAKVQQHQGAEAAKDH